MPAPAHGRRADAAQNADRILVAARSAFSELGPSVAFDDIAARANVGVATVYRHFPSRGRLATSVLEHVFPEVVGAAVADAMTCSDGHAALGRVVLAALDMAWEQRAALAAAKAAGPISPTLTDAFVEPITTLLAHGQERGDVRGDIEPADVLNLVIMLVGAVGDIAADREDLRRYGLMVLDGLRGAVAPSLPGRAHHVTGKLAGP